MKRKFRLRSNREIGELRRTGRAWANSMLVLIARPNALEHSRFGFSVSRRIGSAVRRNRVRRLLREAARLRFGQLFLGWDLLVIARAPIAGADFWVVDEALADALGRAGLLRTPEEPEAAPDATSALDAT